MWKVCVILSDMESISAPPPDPAGDLAAAEAARRRLTESLRLPSWFHTSLGAAVAVQIAGVAYGVAADSGRGLVALAAGCTIFLAVAGLQLARFQRLNRVRVDGLYSRAVMGTSARSASAYAAGLGGGVWAASEGQLWLTGLASLAGGVGYALSGRAWWATYQRDPETHARAESRATLLVGAGLAVAGLLVLVALT